MKNVWLKLKALRPQLTRLNTTEFEGVTQGIEQARIEFRCIQIQLAIQHSDTLATMEKVAMMKLEKWSLIRRVY